MALKNCSDCGKIYVENVSGLCPDCLEKEEEQERLIIDFLRKKDKASVEEIHKETGVKERTILRMMKKGRFLSYGDIAYKCESCDKFYCYDEYSFFDEKCIYCCDTEDEDGEEF